MNSVNKLENALFQSKSYKKRYIFIVYGWAFSNFNEAYDSHVQYISEYDMVMDHWTLVFMSLSGHGGCLNHWLREMQREMDIS